MRNQSKNLPCVWVINIFWIRPILTVLFWSWCCVASPQSNSHTSPPSWSAKDEWFLVEEGWADAVPRNVILTEEREVGAMTRVVSVVKSR